MKTCPTCRGHKLDDAFYKKAGGEGLRSQCKECHYRNQRIARQAFKAEMIRRYGGHCVCCYETEPSFLSIDHTYGGGTQERKRLKGDGVRFYQWLAKQGWPRDRYQLLCMNCNTSKKLLGVCAHNERWQIAV